VGEEQQKRGTKSKKGEKGKRKKKKKGYAAHFPQPPSCDEVGNAPPTVQRSQADGVVERNKGGRGRGRRKREKKVISVRRSVKREWKNHGIRSPPICLLPIRPMIRCCGRKYNKEESLTSFLQLLRSALGGRTRGKRKGE